ncbi:hypothetical protein NIM87_07570 [Devosia sp. XJ19-1]|uniref:Uncharacterized protein n=1 Tax=Devosia ureilytica TaxID=2952754 RepID=A0A9Q4ALJ1_9HYPH|nr:hypothetical protein [Devosia ureilytica]MCP8883353.1 hypothetical protein [Devosia ureilytica]MCP8886279.1 hypothetical protein [Devosia ureilytica]
MAKTSIRFSVTNGFGHRAATWNLRAQKSKWGQEIYLTCRELKGTIHTSFHATGEWHTTYSQAAFEDLLGDRPANKARHKIEKWQRPNEVKPGITLAYKVLTPWSATTTPITEDMSPIIQIPNVPQGYANETMVLIVRSGMSLEIVNATLLGQTELLTGERLLIVNHAIAMPTIKNPGPAQVQFFRGKSRSDLASEHLRALVFLDDQNGNRMILDSPVAGLKN